MSDDIIDDLVADIIDSAQKHVRIAAEDMERLTSYPVLAERYGDFNLGLDFGGTGGRMLRRDIHLRLREKGMSLRAIAATTGVSHEQVRQDVKNLTAGEGEAVNDLTDLSHDEPEHTPPGPYWVPLQGTVKAVRSLTDKPVAEVAASVPSQRRASTAKRLRELGRYFGAVAMQLEEMS